MKTFNKEIQDNTSPSKALQILKDGNARFVASKEINRDLLHQIQITSGGQWPHSVILSCIDSRVPAEIVFDQGIGDIFSARVAGNIVNEDLLGSIEFGCKVAGSKLVVVLGHTHCGAVKGACDDVQLGNITTLLSKIRPAVKAVKEPEAVSDRTSANEDFVNSVVAKNVELTMEKIKSDSPLLAEMEEDGDIMIVGGVYDISNGKVSFF